MMSFAFDETCEPVDRMLPVILTKIELRFKKSALINRFLDV
jgi:hypothetical protein